MSPEEIIVALRRENEELKSKLRLADLAFEKISAEPRLVYKPPGMSHEEYQRYVATQVRPLIKI